MTISINPDNAWSEFEPTNDTPWDQRRAAHLMRRAGFSASPSEIQRMVESGCPAAIDGLFDFSATTKFDSEMETAGRMVSGGPESNGLAAWWLLRMVQTPCPLQEKMTLFWHGHFATGAEKVRDARAMLRQNNLLREHCLGDFEKLVSEISRDVAMLIYLDSTENRKTRPNENYARELMELFCLSPGNYSEQDIKEVARCFTGWEVRKNRFKFNPYQHDRGVKEFLGVSGNYDGEAAIKTVLDQPAAPRFIARKLIQFFVLEDEQLPDELVEPIALKLRESEFVIAPAVRMILSSRLFFSERAIARKIKSPVELGIGTLRTFEASVNMQQLGDRLQRLGQLPLYPPNVKGWDGGKAWINASTVLARANLVQAILVSNETRFAAGNLGQWTRQRLPKSPEQIVDWVNQQLLAMPPKQPIPTSFVEQIRRDPAVAFSALAAIPEYQLN